MEEGGQGVCMASELLGCNVTDIERYSDRWRETERERERDREKDRE